MTPAALGRALLLAACIGALGALAACGDDDGIGIFTQQRDIAGTWVRVAAPSLGQSANPPTYRDTLVLRDDGTGRWSLEDEYPFMLPASRHAMDVVLDGKGTVLFLNMVPCPVCFAASTRLPASMLAEPPALPRFSSFIAPPHYRVRRTGAASLELEELITTDRRRSFYRRVSRGTLP